MTKTVYNKGFVVENAEAARVFSLQLWAYKISLTPPLFIEVPVPS
jgi:hypothetical protein